MKFRIGDTAESLNDSIKGEVIRVGNDSIVILTDDDFHFLK